MTSLQWTQSRLIHSAARAKLREDPSAAIALYLRGVRIFRYDREALIEASEAHLDLLEKTQSDELSGTIAIHIALLRDLTGDVDGMVWILDAWFAAVNGDRIKTDAALTEAEKRMPASIILERAAMHIADILDDRMLRDHHRKKLIELLPAEYFEEDSELRRILLKQHPWLDKMEI